MIIKEYWVQGAFGSSKSRPGFFLSGAVYVKTSQLPVSHEFLQLEKGYIVKIPSKGIRILKYSGIGEYPDNKTFNNFFNILHNNFFMKKSFLVTAGGQIVPTEPTLEQLTSYGVSNPTSVTKDDMTVVSNVPAGEGWAVMIQKKNFKPGGGVEQCWQKADADGRALVAKYYAVCTDKLLGDREIYEAFYAEIAPETLLAAEAGDKEALRILSEHTGEALSQSHFQDSAALAELAASIKAALDNAIGKETVAVVPEPAVETFEQAPVIVAAAEPEVVTLPVIVAAAEPVLHESAIAIEKVVEVQSNASIFTTIVETQKETALILQEITKTNLKIAAINSATAEVLAKQLANKAEAQVAPIAMA